MNTGNAIGASVSVPPPPMERRDLRFLGRELASSNNTSRIRNLASYESSSPS